MAKGGETTGRAAEGAVFWPLAALISCEPFESTMKHHHGLESPGLQLPAAGLETVSLALPWS